MFWDCPELAHSVSCTDPNPLIHKLILTAAIADALQQLGISPVYHMREVSKNRHQALWIEALDAKFEGKGAAWKREDFEKILAGFEVGLFVAFHTSHSRCCH